MKKALKWWGTLSPTGQVITIVFLAIAVYAVYYYGKSFFGTLKGNVEDLSEKHALASQGIHPSYNDSQYETMAEDLFSAMDGPGTTFPTIQTVFSKMKNDADVMELERAFGLRLGSWESSWISDPTDLRGWLRDDLGSDLLKQLNSQLSRQGISKTF